MLELFPGAAGAGSVAAGGLDGEAGLAFREVELEAGSFLARVVWRGNELPGAGGGGHVVSGERGLAALKLAGLAVKLAEEILKVRSGAEEIGQRFLLDGVHQGDEEVVGLVLILDEWILLALGAEADAFAERVHVVEVCLPLLVNGDENHAALLLVEDFVRQAADLDLVGFLHLADEVFGNLLRRFCGIQFLCGEADGQVRVHPAEQLGVVGGFFVALLEVFADLGGDGFLDDLGDEFARGLGAEDFVAVAVNDLALLIHHIVEIQDALAPCVVALLDAFLGGLDRAVEP